MSVAGRALALEIADGDERDFQLFEQQRNGNDLGALLVDRSLAEHEALARGPGGNQMQRQAVLAMRREGPTVDHHKVGLLLAQAFHPISGHSEQSEAGSAFITLLSA